VILSTLDKKQSIIYLIQSIGILIFSLIYESFSHDVYSPFMMYAFLIPLILGFIPSLILRLTKRKVSKWTITFYNLAIATLTIYSLLKGFLEIYGTTNSLINVYIYATIALFILAIDNLLKK